MKKKEFSAEQVTAKLRKPQILMGQGSTLVHSAVQQGCSKKKRSCRSFSATP